MIRIQNKTPEMFGYSFPYSRHMVLNDSIPTTTAEPELPGLCRLLKLEEATTAMAPNYTGGSQGNRNNLFPMYTKEQKN